MRLKMCALAIMALGASGLAQAEAVYSANFSLVGPTLPGLLTGTGLDNPNVVAPGSWTSNNRIDTATYTQDLISATTDPVSGDVTPTWGNNQYSSNMHRVSGNPLMMGATNANVYGGQSQTYGSSGVYYNTLGATIKMQDEAGNGTSYATWGRNFSLNAHSSFTFSGLAKVGITDPLNDPLNAATTFQQNADLSFASLTLADAADRVRTSISASIFGLSGIGAGIFSYATDASGLLSLTITNNFDTAINGSLQAGSYVNALSLAGASSVSLASPVPEPSTYLTMVLGLGIVGAVARRKMKLQSPSLLSALTC